MVLVGLLSWTQWALIQPGEVVWLRDKAYVACESYFSVSCKLERYLTSPSLSFLSVK